MNTITKVGTLALICSLMVPKIVVAYTRDSTDLTSARPNDYRYLWYGQVINAFDSAQVRFVVGEFRLHNTSGVSVRSNMRLSEATWQTDATLLDNTMMFSGADSLRGRDQALVDVLRTELGVAPSGGTVSYVVKTSVEQKTGCAEQTFTPLDPSADTPKNYRDAELALSNAGAILDTTSLVVELVNTTDNTVYTLDSICIMPNPGRMMPATGGTNVTSVLRTATIPTSCYGDTIYLRAVPYRWGSTPYGVSASLVRYPTSLSSQYKNLPTTYDTLPRFLDTTFADSVQKWQYQDLVSYLTADTTRDCLPIVFGGLSVPNNYATQLDSVIAAIGLQTSSYCDCLDEWRQDSAIIGNTLYPPVQFSKAAMEQRARNASPSEHLFSLSATEFESAVDILVPKAIGHAQVNLYDVVGRKLGVLWEGETPYSGTILVPTSEHGVRIITLAASQRHATTAVKVMVR